MLSTRSLSAHTALPMGQSKQAPLREEKDRVHRVTYHEAPSLHSFPFLKLTSGKKKNYTVYSLSCRKLWKKHLVFLLVDTSVKFLIG